MTALILQLRLMIRPLKNSNNPFIFNSLNELFSSAAAAGCSQLLSAKGQAQLLTLF
jgi:hypothetical protein